MPTTKSFRNVYAIMMGILAVVILIMFLTPTQKFDLDKLQRSVVLITATNIFGGNTGTGFFIGENLILTNEHVISEGMIVSVKMKGSNRQYPVRVIAASPYYDVALLRINDYELFNRELDHEVLPVVSSRYVTQGDTVYTYGNPWSSVDVLTKGIIAGRANIYGESMFNVDLEILNGNSGGPLLNEHGEVIGITNKILSAPNAPGIQEFAQTSDIINKAIKDLLQYGQTLTPTIGLGLYSGPEYKEKFLRVLTVKPGSAAERAGLQPDDVLVGMKTKYANVYPLTDFDVLYQELNILNPDDILTFTYLRDEKVRETDVKLTRQSQREING